mmetsp:Transcript_57917/g.159952  ORF Transcript_57917/g.159952 Transcript_57917/m.159952 type:complete len:88 (+) Transcript_57917:117-380(+)
MTPTSDSTSMGTIQNILVMKKSLPLNTTDAGSITGDGCFVGDGDGTSLGAGIVGTGEGSGVGVGVGSTVVGTDDGSAVGAGIGCRLG